jgi:hypothetical protein
MYELVHHPLRAEELFAAFLLVCIVSGTVVRVTKAVLNHKRQTVLDDMEATLKMEMIERGMSADDIAKVLNVKTKSFPSEALERLSQAACSHGTRHSFRARRAMDRAMREGPKSEASA